MKKPVIIAIIIAVILIAILGVVVFTNNNKEESKKIGEQPITADEFKSSLEDKGYVVMDSTSQMEQYENIKKVYIATDKDYSYRIEFYELTDNEYATSFYNTNRYNFKSSKADTDQETETDGSIENYSKYTLLSESKYKVVARINNTLIYLDVDATNKDTIDGILKDLGY